MDTTDDAAPATAAPTAAPTITSAPTNSNTIANTNAPTNTNDSNTQPHTQRQTTLNDNTNTTETPTPPTNTHTVTHTQETLFNVPNHNLVTTASPATYRQYVHTLHNEMAGGDVTEYFETRIALPRSLQGLKTGQVISRILAQNPTIDTAKWHTVTADVVGTNLVVGTVSKEGKVMIDGLHELKVEPGRTAKVPPASKPNNLYYVEILLPYERELHVDLFEAFLLAFPTAKYVSMPGKKPFGTTRRIRLYFNTTTAPREVFTCDDPNTPIREIKLKCGTAAQIIHKWQRLNQFRPPHLMNRWQHNAPTRSYAAAAQTSSPTTTPTNANPTHNQPRLATQHHHLQPTAPPRPIRRTDAIPTGPPQQVTPDAPTTQPNPSPNANTNTDTTPARTDWMSDEPFPPPPNIAAQQNTTNPPNNNPTTPSPPRHTTQDHTPSPAQGNGPRTQTPNQSTHIPNIPPHQSNPNPTPTTNPQHPQSDVNTTPTPASHHNGNDSQWQQVRRNRPRHTNPSPQPSANPTLKKSSSRIKRKQLANKYAPLDFEILPSYEDDDIAPIEVTISEKPIRPPRRKYRTTKKAFSKQALEAFTNPQQIRHPANTLQFLSPRQTQVMIRSKEPATAHGRDNLIRQIALIRAARNNTTNSNTTLDPCADDAFIQQVQSRMADCQDPPNCDQSTNIDIPLSTILDKDETRVRASVCYAWIDIASRATLPHLYDAWPDPPTWHGTTLNWLHSTDGETPCLQDEALALLAACPSLQNVWQHFAASTPDLRSAIQTTSNQWHMFNHETTN